MASDDISGLRWRYAERVLEGGFLSQVTTRIMIFIIIFRLLAHVVHDVHTSFRSYDRIPRFPLVNDRIVLRSLISVIAL